MQVKESEWLKNDGWVGFAHVYLNQCNRESKTGDKIDIEVYAKLVELDAKLGTGSSEQLFYCLIYTTRWDIIKVIISSRNKGVKKVLDYRLQTN